MIALNRSIVIVFQPYDRSKYNDRRRFGVGAYSLHKYIGEHNAKTALSKALRHTGDRLTVKLRSHGRIDFYYK